MWIYGEGEKRTTCFARIRALVLNRKGRIGVYCGSFDYGAALDGVAAKIERLIWIGSTSFRFAQSTRLGGR